MSETELIRPTAMEGELTIPQLAGNMEKLREVMKSVMRADSDYGVIPGTKSKPTLLKPGGEKLAMMFRFAPQYEETIVELPGGHREYRVKCRLIHIPTQLFAGEASAVCSTMEAKYRYRGGALACPECSKSAIIKGKAEYGGGWVCFKRKGGCGAKFPDEQFSTAMLERIENPDIADSYNTVQQIGQKRAFISAIKTATSSSELFTQDVEDGTVPGQEVEHRDDHRQVEPEKPKPREETREWLVLKEALVKVGCTPGKAEEARAVIKFVMPGVSLEEARAAPAAAKTATDALDAALLGNDPQAFLKEAFVAAGLLKPEPVTA